MEKVSRLRQRNAGKSIPLEVSKQLFSIGLLSFSFQSYSGASRRQEFAARKARKYLAQKNRLILPALELAYVFSAIAHAPRQVIVEYMIPHVYEALGELGVLETNHLNGLGSASGNANPRSEKNKATQKNRSKTRSKTKRNGGCRDDLCLARFLEGVCWRFVAYPVCHSCFTRSIFCSVQLI